MILQSVAVAVLVVSCTVFVMWALMPASLRRRVAAAMLRRSLPASLRRRLQKQAIALSGCGCDGCDQAPSTPAAPVAPAQPIRFHPRPPR